MSHSRLNNPKKLFFGCSVLLAMSHEALGVGFIVTPTSHNTGIANAGSAVYARSTASINNNPAAMSLMHEKQIGGNLSLVVPDWSVNENWDCNAENNCADSNSAKVAFIPTLGLIRPMDNNFTWGVGLGAVAGNGFDYGDKFKTRPIVTENTLSVVELINSISWRMDDQWTFGVGVGILYGSFDQEQSLPSLSDTAVDDITSIVDFVGMAQQCTGNPIAVAACRAKAFQDSELNPATAAETLGSLNSYLDGAPGTKVKLEGDDFGAELTIGSTYEFLPGHRLGVAYHWYSDFIFDGTATISGQLLSDEEYQKPHASLTWDMPSRFIVSGSHKVTKELELFWDFERVFFDAFKSTDLRIDGYHPMEINRNFNDANRYAVGAEYGLNEKVTLQLGFSYDESPVDDSDRMADIPVDDIIKTSIGTIYQVNDQLNIHGYLLVEFLGDGEVEQLASIDGQKFGKSVNFDTDARLYVMGVSFGYKF